MIIPQSEYKKAYTRIIQIRRNLYIQNKKLLNDGKKEEYQNNCNVLMGMTRVIDKLPKP